MLWRALKDLSMDGSHFRRQAQSDPTSSTSFVPPNASS
nr:hypothetical protein [Bradyrhizobium sp. Y36]